MDSHRVERLRQIKSFPSLVKYLRDDLDWPIEVSDFDELTFDYEPDELGIDKTNAAKIQEIKQLRPLAANQPYGIFFLKFEPKHLPVVVLRRILSQLVIKKRASGRRADQPAWHLNDLLFISNYGDQQQRQITFAQFANDETIGDLPVLRVLGWDDADTFLHLDHVDSVLTEKLRWPIDDSDVVKWRTQWSSAFVLRHREVITTSKQLSLRLAELAKRIRNRAKLVLAVEAENGVLRKLHKSFKTALIHDLSEDDFADMYAQTIAYGLLAARVSRPVGITADNLTDLIPITNPFLKEMLSTFLKTGGRKGGLDFDELGVADVVDLLNSPDTHIEDIMRDFGNRTRQEDPVIHFYELFLKEYDKKKKVERGVFYTPQPVVSYIVRSVDELLRTEFGLEDGLADTTTWGEMVKRTEGLTIPGATSPDQAFVQILDPATGTGTFLVEVIDVIYKSMTEKWKRENRLEFEFDKLWNEYVPKHLLPRLHGYELLMAPYAIAHLKIGLKLFETGYRFGSDERARIYLTNALEPASSFADSAAAGLFDALAHEAREVNEIKRKQLFTVVVGNPPYANFGQQNRIPFILELLEDYKRDLKEKKLNLDDDFIKFLRLAQYLLENAGMGLLGFITNNTYFDGITHRRMRASIRMSMSEIRIVNLHGSSAKKEICPDGEPDSNVFDIRQGVGISLWTKNQMGKQPADVIYTDFWGARQAKYDALSCKSILSSGLVHISPQEPYHFFVPKDFDLAGEYERGISLTSVFGVNGNGIQTDRDELFIDESRNLLRQRMNILFSNDGLREPFRSQYRVEDSSSYPLLERLRRSEFHSNAIMTCLYRPFDVRWIYYEVGLTSRPAWDIMRHMRGKRGLGLITMRQFEYDVPEPCYFFVTIGVTERRVFVSNRGAALCFPLYLDGNQEGIQSALPISDDRINLQKAFVDDLMNSLGIRKGGHNGLQEKISPEDIFNYIYAVFHSHGYRFRYAEFLKIDFPRLPLTSSLGLFRTLAELGGELVGLHLMESPKLDHFITTYIGPKNPEVEKVGWSDDTVWLNAVGTKKGQPSKPGTIGFHGVPDAVWNFHIGGYQVCEKWLKDRKGRTLSKDDIAHYQKIVVALNETIRLMAEIDKVIDQHGGWPGAFQSKG